MYNSLKGMLTEVANFNGDLAELIIENEILKFETTREEVMAAMKVRREIMASSTKTAIDKSDSLKETFISGIAKAQMSYASGSTLCGELINKTMARALSASEVNAAMGKICAMPTAGSCGIVPAVLESLGDVLDLSLIHI